MDISLLAIDVDGTLVTDENRVSEPTKDAMHRAHEAGLGLVLATGRRYRTTRRVIDEIGLPLPAVCLGGALTKHADGRTLHAEPFEAGQVERLLELARHRGLALILQRNSDELGGADYLVDSVPPWNAETHYYVEAGGATAAAESAPEDAAGEVLVVGCFGEHAPLAGFQRDVAREHGDEFASVLVRSQRTPGWYLETIMGHVSKWSALARFASGAGIPNDAVCAVGDALNDLPMIREAALGVAMGNADPEVKAAADWTTAGNGEHGVAVLIDRLLAEGRPWRIHRSPT